jgi:DNA-binding MarR family transcriptional regulator
MGRAVSRTTQPDVATAEVSADELVGQIEHEHMLLSRYSHMREHRTHRRAEGLDRSAYVLLSRIEEQGPMSIGDLSDAFGLDSSTLNRQTAAAARAGLLQRIPDPDGGIARKFRITAEGKDRLASERAFHIDALGGVLAEWSEEDLAGFAAYLHRFNADIERRHGRPWPRPGGGDSHQA